MKLKIIFSVILLAHFVVAGAQNDRILAKERAIAEQKEKLQAFKNRQEQALAEFKAERNAAYELMLRRKWVWMQAHSAVKAPDINPVRPIEMPEEDKIKPVVPNPQPIDGLLPKRKPSPAPEPVVIDGDVPDDYPYVMVCTDYACCPVRLDKTKLPHLQSSDESAVADFWKRMSSDDFNPMLSDLLGIRDEFSLCDWQLANMLKEFAAAVYQERNDRILLRAFILTQFGYDVRLGRDNSDDLYLFHATDICLVNAAYYTVNNIRYYDMDHASGGSIWMVEGEFTGTLPMRFIPERPISLAEKPSEPRTLASEFYRDAKADVSVNLSLIELYDNYPQGYFGNDYETFYAYLASFPMDETVVRTLYPALNASLEGKNELDKVEIILNFVQTAFEYKTDMEAWGVSNRGFYPEETLYYPYSDCEDRAVLFSRLVRDLVGLPVALVLYPRHLAAAVAFRDGAHGDFVQCDGAAYTITDPTYINAGVGRTMPGMENESAFVMIL